MDYAMLWQECLSNNNTENYKKYLRSIIDSDVFDWSKKYFLFWQVQSRLFRCSNVGDFETTKLQYILYHQILMEFQSHFQELEYIDQRENRFVIVMVQQFLGLTHGPTKTTLDRASILNRMGKDVMIVNTAELYGGEPTALLKQFVAGYYESYCQEETFEYQGNQFLFFQFENNMPNLYNAGEFFEFVQKCKPAYIVNIGGQSLVADTCSKLVPVLNVNTVPSDIAITEATMQVTGKSAITEEDEVLLSLIGKSKKDVLQGRFTSSLKEQTHTFSRVELGLPEDRCVLVVVGGRLGSEVTKEFVSMLHPVLEAGAYLAILGKMDSYDSMCAEDIILKENSCYLGFQDDALAVLEMCDIYVNPDRTGGGTSVIEAMYKGLPAVSLDHGDVALGAGKEFCVKDYQEMQKQLLRYLSDNVFYMEMSEKAKKRADYMLDSETAFREIMEQFLARCQ